MVLGNVACWLCEDRAANVVLLELDACDANDACFGAFGGTGQGKRRFLPPIHPALRQLRQKPHKLDSETVFR